MEKYGVSCKCAYEEEEEIKKTNNNNLRCKNCGRLLTNNKKCAINVNDNIDKEGGFDNVGICQKENCESPCNDFGKNSS